MPTYLYILLSFVLFLIGAVIAFFMSVARRT